MIIIFSFYKELQNSPLSTLNFPLEIKRKIVIKDERLFMNPLTSKLTFS